MVTKNAVFMRSVAFRKRLLKDIREEMWEEQKHLCAYCMRKIDNPSVVRIEHCRPRHPKEEQEHDKKATLDFK